MAVAQIEANIDITGLSAVKQSLSTFKNQLNDAFDSAKKTRKSIQDLGKNMQDFGDKTKEAGQKMMGVTTAITAGATASILASNNIENAMTHVSEQLGVIGHELKGYEDILENVSRTGIGSFEETAGAVVNLRKGLKGLDYNELEGATKQAMRLAKVIDTDVNEVTRAADMMSKQFGINWQQSFNLLAQGQQKGINGMGDMLDIVNEYSVHFKQLGFDAEDMFNILIQANEKGSWSFDKTGDAIKEFGIRIVDGSDATAEAIEALGLSPRVMAESFQEGGAKGQEAFKKIVTAIGEVDNIQRRNEIGVALLGTMYEDLGIDVIKSLGSAKGQMNQNIETSKELAESMTFEEEILGFWNDLKIAIQPVGDVLKQFVLEILPPLIQQISALSEWFVGLGPIGQRFVVVMLALAAAIGPVLIALGSVINVIGFIIPLFAGIGASVVFAIKMIAAVISGGIIVAAIIALVVAIIQHWDELGAWFGGFWEKIKGLFSGIWEWIKGFFEKYGSILIKLAINPFGTIFSLIVDNWDQIAAFFKQVWTWLFDFFSKAGEWIIEYLPGIATKLKDFLLFIAESIWEGLKWIFEQIASAIVDPIEDAIGLIKKAMNKIADILGVKLKFPEIKVPKFSISGGFSLSPLSVPKIDIGWYQTGGIATGPSVVGIGENGDEAILPLSNKKRMRPFANEVASMINSFNKGSGDNQGGSNESVLITGNQFVVRQESDIKQVAIELERLLKKNNRPRGR